MKKKIVDKKLAELCREHGMTTMQFYLACKQYKLPYEELYQVLWKKHVKKRLRQSAFVLGCIAVSVAVSLGLNAAMG